MTKKIKLLTSNSKNETYGHSQTTSIELCTCTTKWPNSTAATFSCSVKIYGVSN